MGEPEHMRQLLARQVRNVVHSRAHTVADLRADYVRALGAPDALRNEAFALLARATGFPLSTVLGEWKARSGPERALWLDRLVFAQLIEEAGDARTWLQRVLEQHVPEDEAETVSLLCSWYPSNLFPTLCVQTEDAGTVRSVLELALSLPQIPIALAVTSTKLSALTEELAPRERAVLLEGVVQDQARPAPRRQAGATDANGDPAPVRAEPAGDLEGSSGHGQNLSDSPELGRLRAAAREAHAIARASVLKGKPDEVAIDAARSLAERFLHELLQAGEHTRDVFELNGRLPFKFGTRDIEVDLVSRALRLALEVDGYFHFTEQDAYRRDRRKDVLLQRHGFLVARYLAEDVLVHTDEVRSQIESLVTERRSRSAPGGGSGEHQH